MQTWIFQANPDRYDIDGFLESGKKILNYRAAQRNQDMKAGDQVFIWRSAGRSKSVPGIIAECVIEEPARLIEDDAYSKHFWIDDEGLGSEEMRVQLSVVRSAGKKEMIKRDWLISDPVANKLTILAMANSTNYLIEKDQAIRLNDLWNVTGRDWTRSEVVAGLWAYAHTYDGSVSKTAGSPVSLASLRTGRTVSGIYNNVMNFRSIDPRDPRAGMSSTGNLRPSVWIEFYDMERAELRVDALDEEFERLWPAHYGPGAIEPTISTTALDDQEASKLLKSLSLAELLARLNGRSGTGDNPLFGRRPRTKVRKVRAFVRDDLLVAIIKKYAGNECELQGCLHPGFQMESGDFYCEVHHIVPLADGGEDSISNMVCVCPSHHLEAHYGANRDTLKRLFEVIRTEKPIV